MMFIKSPFLGYPWWSTALWTARTTRRRRPGRSLTLGIYTLTCLKTLRKYDLVVDGTVEGKVNHKEEVPTPVPS